MREGEPKYGIKVDRKKWEEYWARREVLQKKKCPVHSKYKFKRQPRTRCTWCWFLWTELGEQNETPNVTND
jgi:hypothetical protein